MTSTVTITGSLYDARTGTKITSGTLYLKPKSWIANGGDLVIPKTISYSIPGTGNISLTVSPSSSASIQYFVEFDPNPADTATPRALKDGYFSDNWTLPSTGPVDIASL